MELTLNGRVTFNQEQVARVYPIFGGTVTEVHAETGDYVQKGEVLAVIRSGEVADYEKQRKMLPNKCLPPGVPWMRLRICMFRA